MSAYLPDEQVAQYRRETRRSALDGMRKLVESLRVPPGVKLTSSLRNGEPHRLIVDEVSRRGVELVAMGTHGRPGLSHALIGSVTESVLHEAPCDMLVSHPAHFVFELP
jgi:nucleotide-binding universal stress UspA family protein